MAEPNLPDEAAEFLSQLPSGVDPIGLFEEMAEPAEPSQSTREGRPLEEEEDSARLDLSEETIEKLSREMVEMLARYDQSMKWRLEREQEILDNYDLEPSGQQAGEGGDSSRTPSSLTTTMVDQATSRIITNTMSVDPIMAVKPILGAGEEKRDEAASVERGLNNYAMHTVDFENLLPVYLTEAGKLGTVVLRVSWEKDDSRLHNWYDDSATLHSDRVSADRVRTRLIENDKAIIWPPTVVDWQDAEVAGHRALYTKDRFYDRLVDLGVEMEEAEEMARGSEEEDASRRMRLKNEGVSMGGTDDEKYQLTELWVWRPITDESGEKHERFRMTLHEPSRKILGVWKNTRRRQTHPYYPVRWKLKGNFAWGDGVGHESIWGDSVDEVFLNLEMDNAMAGAFHVVEVVAGSLADRLIHRFEPGQKVPVDAIGEEIKTTQMGGGATEIPSLRQSNKSQTQELVGLPPVALGYGDPTMKSGAGTGSTLALIEQAQGKYDVVAQRVRLDLSAVYTEILELVSDNASDSVLVKHVVDEDQEIWRMMRWTPPSGSIVDQWHIYAQAPSASTSREARKMNYLAVWNFAAQYAGWLQQSVLPVLQQTEPGAVPRFSHEISGFMTAIAQQVIEHHDLPGLKDLVPKAPTPTPAEQQVAQLQQQLAQMQQQLQQMQQPPQAGPPMGGVQ